MWLERQLERLRSSPGPGILVAHPAWGASYLIAGLSEPRRPLVWLELTARDQGDFILQGNKLSDAITRALGSPLFGYGMPYRYGLNVLRSHLELLGPFTFALSNAEYGPEPAQALLEFQQGDNRVLLDFAFVPEGFSVPEGATLLESDTLRLSEEEALALTGDRFSREDGLALWQASGGAYETFLVKLHERLSLPLPLRPGPEGSRPIPEHEPNLEPAQLLAVLMQRGRYLDALELAAERLPEHVPGVLLEAGETFWTQGLQAKLYSLLSLRGAARTKLPEPVRQHEPVLMSRLIAALALGREKEMMPDVNAALAERDSPDLRALYAEGLFEQGDAGAYLREAERAAKAAETPLTLYTYGRALGLRDPEAGLVLLEKGLRLAEGQGATLTAVLIAEALASRQSLLGRYQAAVTWAEWGRSLYDENALNQVALRLGLLNEWAYARVLQGGAAGLEPSLRAEISSLEQVRPSLAELFRTTLADLLLSQGQAGEALSIYRELWHANRQRKRIGALTNLLVRALVEAGEVEEALEVAKRALELTRGLEPRRRQRARLAYGMALSFRDARQAIPILEALLPDFSEPVLAERLAQTGLYLARAYLLIGEPGRAQRALERAELGLKELGESGFRYLAGPPEAFHGVLALLRGEVSSLELRFLGRIEARLHGKTLNLRPRFAELLTALALHPEGLSGEQLTLAVYGEFGDVRRCAVEVGRLKQLVPLRSRPYRLSVSVTADFLRLGDLIQVGRLLESLELYGGPLLPQSDVPLVNETRAFLEESLRQAVVASNDPEAHWILAQRLEDDLDVWDKTLTLLDESDPRTVIARARVKGLLESYGV